MQRAIEKVLPSWAMRLAQNIRRGPGFYGDFADFNEAARRTSGYNTPEIAAAAADTFRPHSGELTARDIQTLAAFAPVVNAPQLSVLDVGGASGYHCELIRSLVRIPLRWVIVETEQMVAKCASRQGIEYALEPPAGTFDVVHMSGVLQYLPDPYAALQDFARRGRWLILNRLPLIERDRLTAQQTPLGSFPAWFFSRSRLMRTIHALGTIRMQWDVPQDCSLLDGRRVVFRGMLVELVQRTVQSDSGKEPTR